MLTYLQYLVLRFRRTAQEIKSHSKLREFIRSGVALGIGMIATGWYLGKDVFEQELLKWFFWSFVAGIVVRIGEGVVDFAKSSYLLQRESQQRIEDLENEAAKLLQAQTTQAVITERPISAALQALTKQPVLEYKGVRFIRRPIDLRNNILGDRDYADSELTRDVKNVTVALAKFYYRPDVDVEPWLSVRAHIVFHDA